MKRTLLAILCATPACGVLLKDTETQKRLVSYQQNAASYYEGRRFDQAEDQAKKGLEIDPKNYKLNLILAMLLLQKGQSDPRQLEVAKAQFEKTFTLRASAKLDTKSYLGYGLCNQKLAQVRRAEAARLRKDSESGLLPPDEARQRLARAEELESMATAELQEAERSYEKLIKEGDQVSMAHYHLMQVATLARRTSDGMRHGEEFLKLAQQRRTQLDQQLEKSFDAPAEARMREELKELRSREMEVRGLLANLAYEAKNHTVAIGHLSKILELDPTRSADYFNRGRCYFALKSYSRALGDLEVFLRQTTLSFESSQVKEANEMRRVIDRELKAEEGSLATRSAGLK